MEIYMEEAEIRDVRADEKSQQLSGEVQYH